MPGQPNYPAQKLLQLALESLQAGNPAEAESTLRQVLHHDPTNPTALHQLALLANDQNRPAEALTLLQQALAADPENPQLLISTAVALHEAGNPREALPLFLRALAIDSSLPDLWNAAGICFQETDQPTQAIEFYLRALALRPAYPEALGNLGVVLLHEGNLDEAIAHFRHALALNPDFADCHSNLAVALRGRFQYAEAVASFRRALALRPNDPGILSGLGEALSLIYNPAAETHLRRAIALRPSDPEKHWNLALHLLKRGNYTEGWREYEYRWQRTRNQVPMRPFTQPQWRNEPNHSLAGATILLHTEQGFGDAFQFLRYVPFVLAQGAHVLLELPHPLHRLALTYAQQLGSNISVLATGDPLPPFDYHTPLMSLPLAFATTLDTIPPPQRFTLPNPQRSPSAQPLRVGLVWSGNPLHDRDRERSLPTETLQPLFDLPNITWVSLQPGITPPTTLPIETPTLNDFADTAALIDTLDLVITVDSAVAHLAASQGAPTWILLPYVADWRWLTPNHPAPNPWYPQARIFRQQQLPSGQPQTELWKPVIADITSALQSLSRST